MTTSERPRDGSARPSSRREVVVLGSRVDALTFSETLMEIDRLVVAGSPVQHCSVNASKIVLLQKDDRLRRIISSCPLVNADGQSVVWAARLLGLYIPGRVTGIDLFISLLGVAEERGYGVYFLGATRDVVEATARRACRDHPGLRVTGWHDGYWDPVSEDAAAVVREAHPDILFVGMPSPGKEYWLADNLERMGVPFSMGVGGTFDVYSGKLRRAPRWMQRAGLEWLFRFAQEPRRMWRRYLLGNAALLRLVARELIARKFAG